MKPSSPRQLKDPKNGECRIHACGQKYHDKYPIEVLGKYEADLYSFVGERYPQIFSELSEKQEISEELDKTLEEALTAYDEEFKETVK